MKISTMAFIVSALKWTDGFTVRQIAERAKVSVSTVYRFLSYFEESKGYKSATFVNGTFFFKDGKFFSSTSSIINSTR